jgi:hypothetical protein
MKTTVHKFFQWYTSSQNWREDPNVTNTLTVGKKHSQDDKNNGRSILEYLHTLGDDKIEVETIDEGNCFGLMFILKNKTYSIQSTKSFEKEMKGKYSLDVDYFCKYYDSIDGLCNDIASSGMDPNHNITYEGESTGETAWSQMEDYI